MTPAPRYGATDDKDEQQQQVVEEEVELLPPVHGQGGGDGDAAYIGDVDASSSSKSAAWSSRHRTASLAIAALLCLFSARYWHDRASSYPDPDGGGGGVRTDVAGGRVPHPPALSDLDPAADLGFRVAHREGSEGPSKAWGERYLDGGGPLPTNQWYLNLLSHRAAENPANSGNVAHVYAVPYVVGVSPTMPPEDATRLDGGRSVKKKGGEEVAMAGINLVLPAMKVGMSNMQMIYDGHNGVSLGAVLSRDGKDGDDDEGEKSSSALTSYELDPDEPLSPLGVSLRWNHANMKSSIVRGMPYGTMRFGRQKKEGGGGKSGFVLPTMTSGNRVVSILVDDSDGEGEKTKMKCGSITGKPIKQSPQHRFAPLTTDGKPAPYEVQGELIFHLDQSDFTWVAFFSRPVTVECYSDVYPEVSVPGATQEVGFVLNVLEVLEGDEKSDDGGDDDDELVVRLALLNECTTGKSQVRDHCLRLKGLGYETVSGKGKADEYLKVLREGSALFPKSPAVGTEFLDDDGEEEDGNIGGRATNVVFDWDVTHIAGSKSDGDGGAALESPAVVASSLRAAVAAPTLGDAAATESPAGDGDFVMFALPHHLEALSKSGDEDADPTLCLHTFHGRTCLVRGSRWDMRVDHGEPQSFLADRPPLPEAVPAIAEALMQDMQFELSENVMRGAAGTYFGAKIIAKMGRVIEINEEIKGLKSGSLYHNYSDADDVAVEESASAAADVNLPSDEDVGLLLDDLQRAVEIWLEPGGKEQGGAEAEFLYDATWGGFVNCGCKYVWEEGHPDNGSCENSFPECPALADVNKDFGNGWYNDHHFHYGYHIYSAAIVAKHRPEWARKYHDRILLYIRDIANPSPDDEFFPVFRQKDWYLGNSWAAGLMSMELSPHGREQESSSEAIAAFEGIALYGDVMMQVFTGDEEKLASARLVRNVGELLTSMEVSAANRFWHVWGSKYDDEGATSVSSPANDGGANGGDKSPHINTYPKDYPKAVVGMMYDTMASFQTWFAPQDVVSYGIQLIPLTAVAERRDDPEWASILYPTYAESCQVADENNDGFCVDNGWSIVQAGLLAETGEIEDAMEMAFEIPEEVFVSDGGCGNSLTNTLWFISTRKQSSMTEN